MQNNGMPVLLEGGKMTTNSCNETLIEQTVTYSLEMNGAFFLIENVPARVNVKTGEQFFSLSTLERLQQIVLTQKYPIRFIETPVYNFAA
jgi:hypothetical protein